MNTKKCLKVFKTYPKVCFFKGMGKARLKCMDNNHLFNTWYIILFFREIKVVSGHSDNKHLLIILVDTLSIYRPTSRI